MMHYLIHVYPTVIVFSKHNNILLKKPPKYKLGTIFNKKNLFNF